MLEVSLSAILFAVLPGVLDNLALGAETSWRVAGLLLAIGLLALLAYQARRRSRIVEEFDPPPSTVRGRSLLLGSDVAISALVALAALTGILTVGAYLIGTGMLLLAADIEFLAFVASLDGPAA